MSNTNLTPKPPMVWPTKPKKVSCWPRYRAQELVPPAGAILISIYDPSDGPAHLKPGWKAVLPLCFHDTDGSQMGLKLFNHEMARQVLDFIRENHDCEHIYVHCAAGQSRSVGLAMPLADEMRVPVFRQKTPLPDKYALYNRRVYRTLIDVIYEDCHDPS